MHDGRAGNKLNFIDANGVDQRLTLTGEVKPQTFQFGDGGSEQGILVPPGASVTMPIAANMSYLEFEGFVGPNFGTVKMSFDPPLPGGYPEAALSRSTNRPWLAHDTFLATPLNPQDKYTFTAECAADDSDGCFLLSTKIIPWAQN